MSGWHKSEVEEQDITNSTTVFQGVIIAFSEGSSPESCDFPQSWSAPNQTGDATLPLRWLQPATLLWTCHLGTPCIASCSQPTSFIKYAIFSIIDEV